MTNEYLSTDDLRTGKWYVSMDSKRQFKEETVIAGPFDSIGEAETYKLPNEHLPSQFIVFQHRA